MSAMRLQFHTTDDVVKALDKRAKAIGISRNAMCAVLLHEALFGQNAGSESDAAQSGSDCETQAEPADKED